MFICVLQPDIKLSLILFETFQMFNENEKNNVFITKFLDSLSDSFQSESKTRFQISSFWF